MQSICTVGAYRELLEDFYGVVWPLEAQLLDSAELAEWLPDLRERMRAPALQDDLAVLGRPCLDAVPLAPVPRLSSVAARFGCLYVLEGSTLGGQIISRQVNEDLKYTPENGCSFFGGRGPATGRMWSAFRGALESYAASHAETQTEIIRAASATFDAFGGWIKRDL